MVNYDAPQRSYDGPDDALNAASGRLAKGVWLTGGRTAVIELAGHLALIDPGDERWFSGGRPSGPLEEILALCSETSKNIGQVLITHAHPDHVANLPGLLDYGRRDPRIGRPEVVASSSSPLPGCTGIAGTATIDEAAGLIAVALRGHSPWGDDLAFYHSASKILFSGDLVQPKGESWEEAFYPSPWPCFADGAAYLESLDTLLALDFETLVTGHREVRFAPAGRGWVELTRLAISRVAEEVSAWKGADDAREGADDAREAGRFIFRKLAAERGIDPETVAKRMVPKDESTFDLYDLPGVLHFWKDRT